MTYIPEVIMVDILSRLPVKSLLRFRCVCKAWCTLISRPQFVETHLHDLAVDLELHLGISNKRTATVLDSCNGLLCVIDCFYGFYSLKPPQKLILWNPSTRQCNHIPCPSFVGYQNCMYSFFYDPDSDDYKINGIDIFTLKTNEWRTVEETHSSVIRYWSATYFNGNLHWLAFRYGEDERSSMVAFSIREEKFQEMELPSQRAVFGLRVLGGCLCVDGLYTNDKWVMEEYGIKESWKRLMAFPYRVGDGSSWKLPRVLRFLENGVLLVLHDWKLVLCDSKNNTWKIITSYCSSAPYEREVGLYIQTLVSPYGSGDRLTGNQ
ncbi:hypothetical protein PVL29_006608 [Vitis rotundifolia]|uniref:F-box domain-containing protein n=1 Tax=Vitis rotundifolia TaxID=103349 RepID=A0AA39DZ38_VITRO|nr:hypothetical protein PVL29_006608 [Vitis rotundifolia]